MKREAAQYIAEQLDQFGMPYEVYDPDIFLSVPISASLEYEGKSIHAKPPAFSRPPGPQGLSGEAVYVPSTPPQQRQQFLRLRRRYWSRRDAARLS